MRRIALDGLAPEELLALPEEELRGLVLTGETLVFRAGSAEILGSFSRGDDRLVIELGHIEGGGEGVLLVLWNLAREYAQARQIPHVEWIVHAVNCADPNLKLRRVLERRGFERRDLPGYGEVYYLLDTL